MKHFLISLFLLLPLCAISQVQRTRITTPGTNRTPSCLCVTLEITMVDLEQLERDKLRIEKNAYRVGLHRM